MTTDPMRFSEAYDPPPREKPDADYDDWLDTLDHHTVGECDHCGPAECCEVAVGVEVAKIPVRWTLTQGDAEHIVRLLELHGHTNRTALLARNLRAQNEQKASLLRWTGEAA
jgi:hypothetical protein